VVDNSESNQKIRRVTQCCLTYTNCQLFSDTMKVSDNLLVLLVCLSIGQRAHAGLVTGLIIAGAASGGTLAIRAFFKKIGSKIKESAQDTKEKMRKGDNPKLSDLTDDPMIDDPFGFRIRSLSYTGAPTIKIQSPATVALQYFSLYAYVLNKAILKASGKEKRLFKKMWLYFTYRSQHVMACQMEMEDERKMDCLSQGTTTFNSKVLQERKSIISSFLELTTRISNSPGAENAEFFSAIAGYFQKRFNELKDLQPVANAQKTTLKTYDFYDEPVML
jgi:hypothetical protein